MTPWLALSEPNNPETIAPAKPPIAKSHERKELAARFPETGQVEIAS
jgi:hypothetical protein